MSKEQDSGVDAVNQDFIRYDQVNKEHTYNLAEHENEDQFDDDFQIKTCDIGQYLHGDEKDKKFFAQELGSAMEEIGFAILVGHGVDGRLYEEAEERVVEMFSSLTLEQKMEYRAERHGSVNQGYFPIKETSDIHPDLVEGWVFCRRAFDLSGNEGEFREQDFWPRTGDEPFFRKIVAQHEQLITPLMQSILRYFDCDPNLYDDRLRDTNFGFRLNYYPPLSATDASSGAGRLLGHEDVDLFTILPAPATEGLQALNRKNMKWIRLKAPRGSIILNTGDYMQHLTNDILPSTTHRVSQPKDSTNLGKPRVSIPMAAYLNENELMEVLPTIPNPKYDPIKAIAFHTRTTSKFYGDEYAVDD